MAGDDELSPKEQARIRSRERKLRPPRMIVDNAGVRRIQLALKDRARRGKPKPPTGSDQPDRPVK
jgi:hypothetical protein